ncbi:MAG: amino acid adenylation domain-containing protein, partial [Ferruginibacter sp.]
PICLDRGPQMIVGIWSILKAGAAYVPIDPDYPENRISYMLNDMDASVMITDTGSRSKIPVVQNLDIIELDNSFSLIKDQPVNNLNVSIAMDQLAYLIYTSGSTGEPKGVMNEHGALANRLCWAQDYFNLTWQDKVLQKTTFCFDVSVWELLWPSLVGAQLVFAKPGGQKDNAYLKLVIEKNKVTVLHFVPSMLGVFLPDLQDGDCTSLKKLLCSGEALKPSQTVLFRQKLPHAELYNLYGPTEAAIDVTCWPLKDSPQNIQVVPIGKPVANTSIYILDSRLHLAPLGGVGEIHIGGIQVARGYLKRTDLTADKFIADPFAGVTNGRLYKTGDLGRWMPDGNIEYLGRIDDQVKVRGYRIELGEIEVVLQHCGLVSQAVVLAKEDKSGNTKLVSYYVPKWEIIKTKEKALSLDRVANWKELYDTEYAKTEEQNIDPEFNLIGWNSSFTGEPIPAPEMREWVEDIVNIILSRQAENVLEIGCGTGLIYYPLAGKVKKYIGTDLSQTSIGQIAERISKGLRDYGDTELMVSGAHEIVLQEDETVDTIVLNSIVQYFPGEDYLDTVIEKCISLLKGQGRIIIGDIRDNRLLSLFKGRLQANILKDATSIGEFKWAVEQESLKENELCIDPAYFLKWKRLHPEVTHIEMMWKQAGYINELSLYRYTAIIYVGQAAEIVHPQWQNWQDFRKGNFILNQLKDGLDTIAIKDVPNPRLWKERFLKNALQDKQVSRVADLLQQNDKEDEETISISGMLDAASAGGYHYSLLLNEDPLKINIVFERGLTNKIFQQLYNEQANASMNLLTNVPLFIDISWQIQKDIRSMLQQKLPDYMVPGEMIGLRQLPLTPNGKVDRKFLSQREDRTVISAGNYLAPATVIEHLLVTVWQEVLGIEQIGIEDNFFELGGDSILTIQIVSRLRRLGYELQPKDIFIHQTIGRLAGAIAERAGATFSGEQGELEGLSGLLPIQQWYLQNNEGVAVSHFNQQVLLGLDKTITAPLLLVATEQLLQQHDALRFKYTRGRDGWQQEYGAIANVFFTEDLQSVPQSSLSASITTIAGRHQQSLDIEKGELIRVVWMQTPETETNNRLLIVIHHLAVDGVSWRILLEDLELLLGGMVSAQKALPGHKSSSYRQWYNALQQYGKGSELISQERYWQNVVNNYEPFATDKGNDKEAHVRDSAYHSIKLGTDQTRRLLQEVPRVYHTEINDILLSVLAKTLTGWSGKDKVIIGLEGHGREDIEPGIDTSRTVGWFTSLYPVLLKIKPGKGDDDLLKTVKEQLRQVPGKGLGYGILKYIIKQQSLLGNDPWDILFNYLGQLDNVVSKGAWLKGAGESAGAGRSEEQLLKEKLSVNSSVRGGQLLLSWSYSSIHYEESTIKKLAADYVANLELLITHCIEQQRKGVVYTPSDYGLGSEISYEELDRFLEAPFRNQPRKNSLESMYRLSGLQQGMLFHGLYDQQVVAYTEQFCCDLINVDVQLLNKSWNDVLKRHSVLRSAFYYNEFSVPVQCVYKDIELTIKVLDYRGMPEAEQAVAVNQYEEADRTKGFDFTAPPLMRLELLRLTDSKHHMLWTYHHILFDGWSLPIVMEDFLTTYEALITANEVMQVAEDRFEDYIRYIERRDAVQEQKYWQNYLKGIDQSTLLPFIKNTSQRTKGTGEYKSVALNIDTVTTARIQSYAQRNRLTVNTIMQGVWSYLLHTYTGDDDILYGVIVSGRPNEITNVEQRVGMFINTLPLHSRFQQEEKIVDWLKEMQGEQVSSRQYQYTPLQDIQRWTGVQGDLFDTLMVFENYPVSKVIASKRWSLNVENLRVNDQTNYPLSILITSAQEISVHFSFNASLLTDECIDMIRHHFENTLLQMVANPGVRLNEINILTAAEEHQLLVEFNDTKTDYPADQSCIGLFEQQAEKTP